VISIHLSYVCLIEWYLEERCSCETIKNTNQYQEQHEREWYFIILYEAILSTVAKYKKNNSDNMHYDLRTIHTQYYQLIFFCLVFCKRDCVPLTYSLNLKRTIGLSNLPFARFVHNDLHAESGVFPASVTAVAIRYHSNPSPTRCVWSIKWQRLASSSVELNGRKMPSWSEPDNNNIHGNGPMVASSLLLSCTSLHWRQPLQLFKGSSSSSNSSILLMMRMSLPLTEHKLCVSRWR